MTGSVYTPCRRSRCVGLPALVRPGQVEDVVDDLERHSQVVTISGEGVYEGPIQLGLERSETTRRGQQARRLACDRLLVGRLVPLDVEQPLCLERLTPAHGRQGSGKAGFVGAEGRRRLPHGRQQPISGEDRDGVAPPGVDAGQTPTGLGLVDHVVMAERPQVQQLHGHSRGDHPVGRRSGADVTSGMRGCQRQRGRSRFPGGDQMCGGLGERRVLRLRRGA